VNMMKSTNAIIGGEGNGGVIVPELHYGRDAIAGVALFLSLLAQKSLKASELKKTYPIYYIEKDKVQLEGLDVDAVLNSIESEFKHEKLNKIDGLKIDLADGWIHIRKSNTEPIIRIYAEASSEQKAKDFIENIKKIVH